MQATSVQALKQRSLGRLERVVTALVEAHLTDPAAPPPDLVARLRRLERSVREARGDRQVIQVITSGRRLIGDPDELADTVPELVLAPEPHGEPARS